MAEEIQMTRDDMLNQLCRLLPSQFKELQFRANVPMEHLPAESTPQAMQAIAMIQYLEQTNQLEQLTRILAEITTAPTHSRQHVKRWIFRSLLLLLPVLYIGLRAINELRQPTPEPSLDTESTVYWNESEEKLNPFWDIENMAIQLHAVTRAEYFIYLKSQKEEIPADTVSHGQFATWTTFAQANAFCAALGARIPTVAEWEHFARTLSTAINEVRATSNGMREWTSTRDDSGRVLLICGNRNNEKRPCPEPVASEKDLSGMEIGFRCVR